MKKILVTGAGGFIGSNLINHLSSNKSISVQGLDNNPRIDSEYMVLLDIKDINKLAWHQI